jgi:hypothetical protein
MLAINSPGSPESESVRSAAKDLDATLQQLTVDDEDVRAILGSAARAPLAQAGESSARWQEGGWFLVPIVALIFTGVFRRETSTAEAAT